MADRRKGPVLIELEQADATGPSPADAPPVPETQGPDRPTAMQQAAVLAARRPSRLARWFWGTLIALLGFLLSVAAWDFVTGLLSRNPVLGWAATGLIGLFLAICVAIVLKELSAFYRLARIDRIHATADRALAAADLPLAREAVNGLLQLYSARDDLRWGRERVEERQADLFDADGLLALAEREVLAPLDSRAAREVEAAARQVATVTAIVPLALADVVTALTANVRMIRRIAEIYGGRSGTLGGWRLTRSVLTHLVATGAVAVGDDLIGSVAGGGVLSRVSRRFGEGVINGALTARVGVAAMEVCRPLPFGAAPKPSVTALVRRSLTGLFASRE